MNAKNLLTIPVTEGEYGSVLEMLYYSVENCKFDVMEHEDFGKMQHLSILNTLRHRFSKKIGANKTLSFKTSEVSCFLAYINLFLPTLTEKETLDELASVKEKIKECWLCQEGLAQPQ